MFPVLDLIQCRNRPPRYVLSRLETMSLSPSRQAGRNELLRFRSAASAISGKRSDQSWPL